MTEADRTETVVSSGGRVPGPAATFLWQAEPDTLRFSFVSGQVERIVGQHNDWWLSHPHPWRALAQGADRQRVHDALRSAARAGRDGELRFKAVDHAGRVFDAQLVIRVAVEAGATRLWGLLTDLSGEERTFDETPARPALPSPPIFGRAARLIAASVAIASGMYALAVATVRPPDTRPAAVAIREADRLERALDERAAEEEALARVVVQISSTVEQLVAGAAQPEDALTLARLRDRIRALLARAVPPLSERLRRLLAQIEHAGARVPSKTPAPTQPGGNGHEPAVPSGSPPAVTPPANAPSSAGAPAGNAPSPPGAQTVHGTPASAPPHPLGP